MKLNFNGAQLKRSQIREVEEMRLKAHHNDSVYKERITKWFDSKPRFKWRQSCTVQFEVPIIWKKENYNSPLLP